MTTRLALVLLAVLGLVTGTQAAAPPVASPGHWIALPGEWPDTTIYGALPAGLVRHFVLDEDEVRRDRAECARTDTADWCAANTPIRYRVTIETS